jgi:pentatricopeptide repeat protein
MLISRIPSLWSVNLFILLCDSGCLPTSLFQGYASTGDMEAARAVFDAMEDPPAGVAAHGNHQNERRRHGGEIHQGTVEDGRIHREPSTWSSMIKAELLAGERSRAEQLLKRVEQRAFPLAGENSFCFSTYSHILTRQPLQY